jgi:hypothetical protein
MLWARLLAYVTGTVNQELLLRNEYLAAENRILRGQIKGRLLLSEGEKGTLAEIAHRLGRKVLEDVAAAAKPDTILIAAASQASPLLHSHVSRLLLHPLLSPAEEGNELERLYPFTPGRFGGHGLLHDGSPNAQGVDDLLCVVLHPLGDSPDESGRIHAVPG